MGLLDKLKNLFKKKENTLVKTVSVPPTEQVSETPEQEIKPAEEIKAPIEETQLTLEEKQEFLELLNSVNINLEDLALDKMQSESEAINSYVKGLLKDLSNHQDFKKEKEKQEQAINSIGKKIKMINQHGLELKNLLANLEDHYYVVVLDTIKKVNDKAKNEQIQKLIDDLEHDLGLVALLDSHITKVIGYNELFNPENNQKFKEDIEKEAAQRVIHGDLNELLSKILTAVTDRTISIKSKIEKYNPIEITKSLI